jgi:hypothetical protein
MRRQARSRSTIHLLAALSMFGTASIPHAAESTKARPKDWVGRPAAELIAVLGPPTRERPRKKDRLLVWMLDLHQGSYPLTGSGSVSVSATGDARGTYGAPPIPGDPTADPRGSVECTAFVDLAGVITRLNFPSGCTLPAKPAASDGEVSGEPARPQELPRSDTPKLP